MAKLPHFRWLTALVVVVPSCVAGCRASWQQPDRVVASLGLKPGDRVADIGAGDGYFVFRLAEAVGPQGRVYAVEVTDEKVSKLADRVQKNGFTNIEVIRGKLDDPLLPDQSIDLVFVCNTYHHIAERTAYFARLRTDLQPKGRVAIVELSGDLTGLSALFVSSDHSTAKEQLYEEMANAGYKPVSRFDYLDVQHFIIFGPSDDITDEVERPGATVE